jgi:hypothetical protein
MNSLTKMPRHPGTRISSYGLLLLATILSAAPLHADTPVNADETGIKGTVLMGPVRPGPVMAGQSDEAPFRASFHVLDVDNKSVTRFESDENGCFTVLLPPGEYTIVPDASAPFPHTRRQRKTVTVPEDGYADVVLRFDTGMR